MVPLWLMYHFASAVSFYEHTARTAACTRLSCFQPVALVHARNALLLLLLSSRNLALEPFITLHAAAVVEYNIRSVGHDDSALSHQQL
jgi:hypothetical protein